ncbi:helix-turn-helix transcriptional regulator [Promicromonospora panici]|uniref:helix-turn-helix domain-containing protein n=1 Tax=Promicromonospora panici TaxID=2219658 RepID=UPI0030F3C164
MRRKTSDVSVTNASVPATLPLRVRRAALQPEDVGLRGHGVRRVPGLRREELAMLAGVSPTYYSRLEQGLSTNASEAVIASIARALNLTRDEQAPVQRR